MRLGIIGGSGVYRLVKLTEGQKVTVNTKFGETICIVGQLNRREVVFLPRHGEGHAVPPHRINYRANVLAMKQLQVKAVLATAATGALRRDWEPGTLLIPDQLLDWTRQRPLTLFEGEGAPVVHVDLTQPFCPTLRRRLNQAAEVLGVAVVNGGCYVCGEGPRYETAFEVQVLAKLGGDVAGMTAGTEAALFREAEICYAIVAVVTNWGAGIADRPLSHTEVDAVMKQRLPTVLGLFERVVGGFDFPDCPCRHALDTYGDKAKRWVEG